MTAATTDVVVVGAGVIGASIAYHLALRGASVVLLDGQRPAESPSASWASAGGLRSQGRHAADAPLTLASRTRWPTLGEELEADLEIGLGGHLHLAESAAEAEQIERRVRDDAAAGVPIDLLDRGEIRRRWPALASTAMAGAYTPGDGQAHPGRTTRAFVAGAAHRGAVLRFGETAEIERAGDRVLGVRAAAGTLRAAAVVVAAGAWSQGLLEVLGLFLPLRWRGLQMLVSDVQPPLLDTTVTAAGRNLSLKQLATGQMMVGGRWLGAPRGDEIATDAIEDHVRRQWATAAGILPAMRTMTLAQHWRGVEAQSIDGLPFIGPGHLAGLYVATGFSGHGFQISPAVGELVAGELLGESASALAPFRIDRAAAFAAAAVHAFQTEDVAC